MEQPIPWTGIATCANFMENEYLLTEKVVIIQFDCSMCPVHLKRQLFFAKLPWQQQHYTGLSCMMWRDKDRIISICVTLTKATKASTFGIFMKTMLSIWALKGLTL